MILALQHKLNCNLNFFEKKIKFLGFYVVASSYSWRPFHWFMILMKIEGFIFLGYREDSDVLLDGTRVLRYIWCWGFSQLKNFISNGHTYTWKLFLLNGHTHGWKLFLLNGHTHAWKLFLLNGHTHGWKLFLMNGHTYAWKLAISNEWSYSQLKTISIEWSYSRLKTISWVSSPLEKVSELSLAIIVSLRPHPRHATRLAK